MQVEVSCVNTGKHLFDILNYNLSFADFQKPPAQFDSINSLLRNVLLLMFEYFLLILNNLYDLSILNS